MSMMMSDYLNLPGESAVRSEVEQNLLWNKGALAVFDFGAIIDGAATDAGNTPTTTLRGGLALGKKIATGKLVAWSPTATDGSQNVYGFCPFDIRLLNADGVGTDKGVGVLIAGYVKAAAVFSASSAIDRFLRSSARNRFIFDDDFFNEGYLYYPYKAEVTKATAYQVLTTDNGTLFDNTGAVASVTFTLPPIAPGLMYGFLATAAQNVVVASTEGTNMIGFNSIGLSNVSLVTAGQILGGIIKVYSNPAGTKWIVETPTKNAITYA